MAASSSRAGPEASGARAAASSAGGGAVAAGASGAPAPAPAVSSSAIVNYARQFLGVPYVWGGTTTSGFDCSGFTQYVFAHFGINLPRTSSAQATAGTRVSAAEARPGDLVWWPGHVGIYTGNGNNIAARQPGTPLTEGPIYHSSPSRIFSIPISRSVFIPVFLARSLKTSPDCCSRTILRISSSMTMSS